VKQQEVNCTAQRSVLALLRLNTCQTSSVTVDGAVARHLVVLKDYANALDEYQPQLVLSCWQPMGVDWTADFRATQSVMEYLMVRNFRLNRPPASLIQPGCSSSRCIASHGQCCTADRRSRRRHLRASLANLGCAWDLPIRRGFVWLRG
jgi:hypothetical protein